jgi:hypothetical protein
MLRKPISFSLVSLMWKKINLFLHLKSTSLVASLRLVVSSKGAQLKISDSRYMR